MSDQRKTARLNHYLSHLMASEVWVIMGALLVIFGVAPHYYGKAVVLSFLQNPHLPSVILIGVIVWFAGMMLQNTLGKCLNKQHGARQDKMLWVPIKAGVLCAILLPIPWLEGSFATHFLIKWVQFVS